MTDEVIEFITRRFPNAESWLSGNCYYFSVILMDRFGGERYYDVIPGHVVTKISDKYYDASGVVEPGRVLVPWDKLDEYDLLQAERIRKAVRQ